MSTTHELLDAYLVELRHRMTATRGLRPEDVDDIVDETADHVQLATDRLIAEGVPAAEAVAVVLARFGSVDVVARTHVAQARMGAAVPTRATRIAGAALVAMLPLAILGFAANTYGEAHADGWRGTLHGSGAGVEGLGVLAFFVGIWGFRRRHAGMGTIGRAAFALALASPFLAAPFGWGAGLALALVLCGVVGLLVVGAWRAELVPRGALAMAGGGTCAVLVAGSAAMMDEVMLFGAAAGGIVAAVGLAGVGLAMWREPALDLAVDAPTPTAAA